MNWNRRDWMLAAAAAAALPTARACEYTTPYLRVIHPWTRATSARDAAISMKFEDVLEHERLVDVRTPVAAGARLGGLAASDRVDLDIPAGRPSELAETGTYLLLTGLALPLEVGRSYPMTLVFAKAGEILATLNVDFGPAPSFRFR